MIKLRKLNIDKILLSKMFLYFFTDVPIISFTIFFPDLNPVQAFTWALIVMSF